MAIHYTAMGQPIDMNKLANHHSSVVALGNAKMNARGDLLGRGGIVVKTQEQIEAEWKSAKEKQESMYGGNGLVNIKDPIVRQQAAQMAEDALEFEPSTDGLMPPMGIKPGAGHPGMPTIVDNRKRRKIVEAD